MTDRPQERLRFLRSKPLGQNIQEPAKRGFVSLREKVFGLAGQLVDVSRLAAAAAAAHRTSLAHDAVALENSKVCSDAVVGEIQRPSEVLDSTVVSSEQRDDPPPRTFEKSPVPACTHIVPSNRFLLLPWQENSSSS